MPVEFSLNEKKRQVLSKGTGLISVEELEDHLSEIKRMMEQGILDETWGQLIHFKQVRFTEKRPVSVVKSLAKDNPWPAESPRVVVTENKFVFALCRMYQQLAYPGDKGIRVMNSLEKAQAYLDEALSDKDK